MESVLHIYVSVREYKTILCSGRREVFAYEPAYFEGDPEDEITDAALEIANSFVWD